MTEEKNADYYIELLKEGNKRYVLSTPTKKDFIDIRKKLVQGQHPWATIISCSDSRVVPEYIFDANPGELFIIRTAGNIAEDKTVLGSIEYGCEHLHTPILLILAHQNCGAVCATCNSKENKNKEDESNIKYIIKTILKSAKKVEYDIDKTIIENAKDVKQKILKDSKIIAHLVNENKLKIILGYYSLESGEVRFFE
jgi:carbonic anhydrase